ncbi:NADH dehydrogenase [ubiquinone] iron-sulfur protein 6, mitochondrial [Rhinichthys klamathensis goyatoka]|uniref:NADH dehydrogenase [ubiquinone] iron-sulfur protein 6, mitochondrial n=1 Tax=Rhinichthys klamathensis goyatoka TaxID=3034132 RepID=UPI0024B4F4DB|nr:NADH dehydrogenase [ubiquinone] iron-sulfur protein 6, mitochondrial [Rhinichthys klamathensis goyatoka]
MAATLPRMLSFGKNTKALLNSMRLSVVPVQLYSVPVSNYGEKVTHTGQLYDENDVRRARFIGRLKEVNENFAINLVAEEPVTNIESSVVSCDGGGGALGHPKVYINLDKETKVGTCGYCGLQFQQKHHH